MSMKIRCGGFSSRGVEIRCGVFQRIEERLRAPEILRDFRAAR